MPDILIIKTSSLGDVLHNLPAISDLHCHLPDARIDWVVEEGFADLPALHPAVQSIFPIAIRRWRKNWLHARSEIAVACQRIQVKHYDLILDTQGLLKSALVSRCARGTRCGYDWHSAREPLASLFYQRNFPVAQSLHAVERNRQLTAAAMSYSISGAPNYGIEAPTLPLSWLASVPRYAVFLHATSRDDKLWGESNWIDLGKRLHRVGMHTILPWGSNREKERAERLGSAIPNAVCTPRLSLREAAALLGRAHCVIGVDTGLNHLAAAFNVPTVGIYTATDPGLTGLYAGNRAINLGGKSALPTPDMVIATLEKLGCHV